jgi:hypothetical protein
MDKNIGEDMNNLLRVIASSSSLIQQITQAYMESSTKRMSRYEDYACIWFEEMPKTFYRWEREGS